MEPTIIIINKYDIRRGAARRAGNQHRPATRACVGPAGRVAGQCQEASGCREDGPRPRPPEDSCQAHLEADPASGAAHQGESPPAGGAARSNFEEATAETCPNKLEDWKQQLSQLEEKVEQVRVEIELRADQALPSI